VREDRRGNLRARGYSPGWNWQESEEERSTSKYERGISKKGKKEDGKKIVV